MGSFLLWCLLFVVCWPVAVAALLLYPFVWLVSLPLRIVSKTASALFDLVLAVVLLPIRLPARVLRSI